MSNGMLLRLPNFICHIAVKPTPRRLVCLTPSVIKKIHNGVEGRGDEAGAPQP